MAVSGNVGLGAVETLKKKILSCRVKNTMPKGQYVAYTDFCFVCPCGRTFDKLKSEIAKKLVKKLHSRFCEKARQCVDIETRDDPVVDWVGYAPPRVN